MPAFTLILAAHGSAQIPDVQVKADIGPTYRSVDEGANTMRWYDPFGRHSTVAFQFALEPGFRAYLSQKIQRIPHDGDPSQIDESYVEDVGNWRAGKQYLPFGFQTVLRESVLAIRSDSDVQFRYFALSVAACDGGEGRPRGLIGRLGTRLGASFAVGRHFGIQGTSFTTVQDPEDAAGRGGGYRRAFGLDYFQREGPVAFHGEYVWLQEAHQGAPNRDVLAATLTFGAVPGPLVIVGYSLATAPRRDQYWLTGSYAAGRNVFIEPFVRARQGTFHDAGITVRVRL